MVLEALCPSSNLLYTKSNSMILRPLKGQLGYELFRSKWSNSDSNSDSNSSGFLLSNSWMALLNRPCFHLSMADNVIAFQCSSVIYPIYSFRFLISKTLCSMFSIKRVNGIPLWDFYRSDFQRALKIIIIAELFIAMTISQG